MATHANPRRLVPMPRLLSDTVIRRVAARDGVIGVMPLNWALDPAWRSKAKEDMHIETVVDAIEIVCQLAGDAWHVGLGTDFDGGQGAADAPAELDTIADLPRLVEALTRRGYADEAVTANHGRQLAACATPRSPRPVRRHPLTTGKENCTRSLLFPSSTRPRPRCILGTTAAAASHLLANVDSLRILREALGGLPQNAAFAAPNAGNFWPPSGPG